MHALLRRLFRPGILLWCSVFIATTAMADVIVLKNGRRITVMSVKEGVETIGGETSAGTISLPRSLVDHVERVSSAAGRPAAAALQWAPPPSANTLATSDTVAPSELQRLHQQANTGDAAAAERAAAVESAASTLEYARGNLDEAIEHAIRALNYDPQSPTLLINAAYYRLRRAEYRAALDYLDRARKIAPDSADVAKLSGWAYFGLNQLVPAIAEWTRSQELRPDPDVAASLAKAQRDLEAEREFREDGSEHFILKYDSISAPELARGILRELETSFQSMSATLNYRPADRIGVLLYTSEAFADITHAPSWVGALNDGRIRIPIQGLDAVTPELAHVLRHELAHSLVGGKTNGRCPVWLQEGIAQWMDGSQVSPSGAVELLTLYDRHEEPSLALLEGSWMQFGQGMAAYAYGWSLAVVESIVRAGGPSDVERLLQRVAIDVNTEAAARSSLGLDYGGLGRTAADYLRRNVAR